MKRKRVEKPWVPRQPATGSDMANSPFGHCSGCFGVRDGGETHYTGSVEHPFSAQQADNYKLGRDIDAIATEVE